MGGMATMMGGRAQRKAYGLEAEQAGLEAKSAELERREMLQDALAMQAVIAGASGRTAGTGSLKAIREADISRAGQDISMIKAGGKAKSARLRATGYRAEQVSMIKGISSMATQAYTAGQVK